MRVNDFREGVWVDLSVGGYSQLVSRARKRNQKREERECERRRMRDWHGKMTCHRSWERKRWHNSCHIQWNHQKELWWKTTRCGNKEVISKMEEERFSCMVSQKEQEREDVAAQESDMWWQFTYSSIWQERIVNLSWEEVSGSSEDLVNLGKSQMPGIRRERVRRKVGNNKYTYLPPSPGTELRKSLWFPK